jgi:cyclophilin family peptidyl-prolyl cis-trans isomerase
MTLDIPAARTTIRRSARPVALGLAAVALVAACSSGTSTTAPLSTLDPYAASASAAVASVPAVSPEASASTAATSPEASPAGSAAAGTCPTVQPDPLPVGQKRTVTVETSKGPITIEIDGALSPIAAGNFVALAGCGYYDGVVFHRLVPGFVIQGGDGEFGRVGADGRLPGEAQAMVGTGGPGYTIKDEPVTAEYGRGVVAMARTSAPDSVGSQFFIVLDDAARSALASANTYQIIGKVTAGMDVVDAIAAMPNSGDPNNAAIEPVPMTKLTVGQ